MATYPDDASMTNRQPDRGFSTGRKFVISKWVTQAGYEKRRLMSRRGKRDYSITYANITGTEKALIENFYIARSGEYETFTFDLTHINETGTVRVKFDGNLDIRHIISGDAVAANNIYTISLKFMEDYD
jgi:hypothetical protein